MRILSIKIPRARPPARCVPGRKRHTNQADGPSFPDGQSARFYPECSFAGTKMWKQCKKTDSRSMREDPTYNHELSRKDETTMNRKIFAIIVLGLVLFASLLACGYFGVKAIRNTRLRRAGMEAYEKKEYRLAENLLRQYGLNTYDYGARQHYPVLARWDRIDPLCEKYYGVSPYAYCANNPVRFVDPDGRVMGDYLDSNGNLIGTDGKNDGRLYVLKTSRSSFDSYGNAPVAGITRKEAKRVVKEGDISNKDNFVEITGSKAIREAAVSKIADDGTGGTSDNNNREYLVTFDKSIEPHETNAIYCKKGPVGDPTKDNAISVSAGDSPDINYIHTHPSGTKNGSSWYQAPSNQDVMNTTTQKYVIGMGDKTVYIYNGSGINATLPLDIYKNYEVTNGK